MRRIFQFKPGELRNLELETCLQKAVKEIKKKHSQTQINCQKQFLSCSKYSIIQSDDTSIT
ncbi:unnamed protein product [Paramecium primaurelia]|uniref:Uncharacterized protein n=1 Tax=Paramecium primaurelia TaxID=5886 RepID=A0A8S1LUH4_PARPR|nr:unnamed protein product [Paramecium primaurelia]